MQSVSCSGLLVNCLGTSGGKKLPSSYTHMYFPAFRSAALPRLPLQPCCFCMSAHLCPEQCLDSQLKNPLLAYMRAIVVSMYKCTYYTHVRW